MKIILKRLELNQFREATKAWDFKEGRNTFYGKNGVGKTTLFDAENWLRTGKNSKGQPAYGKGSFDIKTIVDGVPIEKTDHSVKGIYEVDGKILTLERTFREQWTKTRGDFEKKLTGHTTDYCIDGKSNINKRLFDDQVKAVFDPKIHSLCSDPSYFPSLTLAERNEALSKMIDTVNPGKIIDGIDGFRESLNGFSVDDKIEISTQAKKKINEELKTLPARIDENRKLIKAADGGVSLADAQADVDQAKKRIRETEKEIDEMKTGEKPKELDELRSLNQMLAISESAFDTVKNEALIKHNKKVNRQKFINQEIEERKVIIKNYDNRVSLLRKTYKDMKDKEFENKPNSCHFCAELITCPHCNETDEKAEKIFNVDKSETLKAAIDSAKKLNVKKKLSEQQIKDLLEERKALGELKEPENLSETSNTKIDDLIQQIKDLKEKQLQTKPLVESEKSLFLKGQLEGYRTGLESAYDVLAKVKSFKESEKRIIELEKRMTKLSGEFDMIEKFFFLLGQYNKKMAEATEEPINELFENTSFKMFTTQINKTILPACDITDKRGRVYETALSNGEQIKTGMDIIKTFSKFYKWYAPVFIDNAESVTDAPELQSQTIDLRVSEKYECLTQV